VPGQLVPRTWQYDPTLDAPARYRRACAYASFSPQPLAAIEPTLDARQAGVVSEAERAIRTLNEEGGGELIPLARLLLRTESIASSKVEGLELGVRNLARAEARSESGQLPSATAAEILANIQAMRLAVEEASAVERFGESQLLSIHRRLMERATHRQIAGRFRTSQNWIGGNDYNPCGADFVPPSPDELPRLLDDLYAAINDEVLPPLVQAALVHAQLETIHPFDDGNGRTGRAVVHVIMRRRGIAPKFVPPISVVFAGARERYIDGLTRFRGDDVADWCEYFAAATMRAARLASDYVAAVRRLQQRWRERLQSSDVPPRADATAWRIIELLPAHPLLSAPAATAAIGRSKGRVYEGIELLVAAGVLIPVSQGHRNRWWEADGLFELIEGLEAGLPVADR
jgi:Fic family protein